MHNTLKKIEKAVDRAIPFLVVVLAIIIVLQFVIDLEYYEPWITYVDYLIVAFFVIDLIFKWFKIKNVLKFLKFYWVDIIAVFPLYLLFRVYSSATAFLKIGEEISESQKIAHEVVLVRETKLFREGRLLRALSRESRPLIRGLQFFQRSLRVLRGRFYLAHKSMMKVSNKHKKR